MTGRSALLAILAVATFLQPIAAQDTETVRITHRFDWRRTVDQKYQGLVYGYLTGAWKLSPSAEAGWTEVEARYEAVSESRRNNALIEKPVEAERTARFRISPEGLMTGFHGDAVPYYRNFPAPLPSDAAPGSVWVGSGELVGDFLGHGKPTRIPILIEYRWQGTGDYGGIPVIQVKTQYALRYSSGTDAEGDPALVKAEGSRIGVVSYDTRSRKILFIRETSQERFTSNSGQVIGNEGILLTFFEGVPALGTPSLVAQLNQSLGRTPQATPTVSPPALTPTAEPSAVMTTPRPTTSPTPQQETKDLLVGSGPPRSPADVPDLTIEADPRGVKLTLDNLQFVADQAALLPGEDSRLARIGELLKKVPGRNLLIVGHTAAVGTVESQDQLSVARALAVVQKLKAAGIPPQSLLYEGRGGRDPVASNANETGRARNRRVEILILDQ